MPANGDTQPVTLTSADPNAERVAQMRRLFPECFADGRIDFDKLRAALGDSVASGPERFTFSWAGRADAAALLQTPSRATLVPKPKESENWDTTRNLFVEGDNLEVLKLLYKAYANKVKLIYIDPPYNTGNDFVYPDNFADPLAVYLQLTKQADDAGKLLTSNPETSGRYHSAWLSMMYPRLFLARQLLRDDGVIFVSIDDHEVANLRLLMNEVFGEENFVATIVWQKKYAVSNDDPGVGNMHDYLLMFQRSEAFQRGLLSRTEEQLSRYTNLDNDPRGEWASDNYISNKSKDERPTLWYPIRHPKTGGEVWPEEHAVWRYSKEKHEQMELEGRLYWGPTQNYKRPRIKRYLSEVQAGTVPSTWWEFETCGHNDEAQKETTALIGPKVFTTPKPIRLLKRLLTVGAVADDIVLDFFSGSCSTAQAVLELNREDGGNRRFIMVQLPEPTENKQYPTIAEIGKERIRRVIAKLKKETPNILGGGANVGTYGEDLGFKVFALGESHFAQWAGVPDRDAAQYAATMEHYLDPINAKADPVAVAWELAIKEGYGLNSTVSAAQVGANTVYTVTDPERDPAQVFRACLDEVLAPDIAKQLGLTTTDLFICRDSALDDTLAANLALQCRLKTV